MGIPAAERQRAFRQRVRDGAGERINLIVSVSAKRQLERLARHRGTTQRAVLEHLLAEAERETTDNLGAAAPRDYFDGVTA